MRRTTKNMIILALASVSFAYMSTGINAAAPVLPVRNSTTVSQNTNEKITTRAYDKEVVTTSFTTITTKPVETTTTSTTETTVIETTEPPTEQITEVVTESPTEEVTEPTEPVVEENDISIATDELELLALVVMAEAEGECEEGQRLVIDTILNRVDSEHFPNTITEVIYQNQQFTSMTNGRVDRCHVQDDIYQLVLEEVGSRTNYDVMFFTAGGYGQYGTPMFQIGNHYFASYN